MIRYNVGNYIIYTSRNFDYHYPNPASQSDLDNEVKSDDRMLHQSLEKIFHECSLRNSGQIKELLRDPRFKAERESIIKPILDQKPIHVSRLFLKKELERLSLLWIAVLAGFMDSAELLVRSGADVNEIFGRHEPQVMEEKWTILHLLLQTVSSPENERLIRLVTDHGADLQSRDGGKRTALHYAVARGRVQMTEMLLKKGADVNARDDDDVTPLLAATINREASELVPLLMKHGADVFAKDTDGANVLHRVSLLPPEVQDAAEMARFFIEKGVSLDDDDNDHCQPIHLAVKASRNELVELYLDHGANVNTQNKVGVSPLHLAAESANKTVVETLLKRGASIDLITIDGRTALHAACENVELADEHLHEVDYERVIRLLLSAGANVLAEDSNGDTPFALMSSDVINVEQPGTRPMIEALILKKIYHPSIKLKDERIIERDPSLWNFYRNLIDEIEKMKVTKFIQTCNLFELLAKCHCQIAELMRNPEFETNFKHYDVSEFSTFAKYLRKAFERAQKQHYAVLEQENLIDEAVYGVLPYLVIRRTVHYICNDCCSGKM